MTTLSLASRRIASKITRLWTSQTKKTTITPTRERGRSRSPTRAPLRALITRGSKSRYSKSSSQPTFSRKLGVLKRSSRSSSSQRDRTRSIESGWRWHKKGKTRLKGNWKKMGRGLSISHVRLKNFIAMGRILEIRHPHCFKRGHSKELLRELMRAKSFNRKSFRGLKIDFWIQ